MAQQNLSLTVGHEAYGSAHSMSSALAVFIFFWEKREGKDRLSFSPCRRSCA